MLAIHKQAPATTVVPPALDVARPFPGEQPGGLSELAQIDHALVTGDVPEQLRLGPRSFLNQLELQSKLGPDLAPLVGRFQSRDYFDTIHENRNRYRLGQVAGAVTGGTIGAAVATVLFTTAAATMGIGAIPLALIGGAVGAAFNVIRWRRHQKGSITVDNDGQVTHRKFWQNPANFERSASEWRNLLLSYGILGDTIQAKQPKKLPQPSADGLRSVDAHRTTLMDLANDRRLVTDYGNRSSYGHDVLDVIDAPTARRLIAAGKPVYVVNGQEPESIRHRYNVEAQSPDRKVRRDERNEYVERRFEYRLEPIDFDNVKPGHGVPEGILGVYTHGNEVSQMVYNSAQSGLDRVDGDNRRQGAEAREGVHDLGVERAVPLQTRAKFHEKTGFGPIGGLLGATVGIILGAAVLGTGGLAILPAAAGAVVGYKGLDRLFSLMDKRAQEKSAERRAALDREIAEIVARHER